MFYATCITLLNITLHSIPVSHHSGSYIHSFIQSIHSFHLLLPLVSEFIRQFMPNRILRVGTTAITVVHWCCVISSSAVAIKPNSTGEEPELQSVA